MAGANVDFVIIAVDRPAGCAVASRTMALSRRRWEAKEIAHLEEGSIVDCDVLSVGPSRLTLSCYGYDDTLTQIGLSYSYLETCGIHIIPGKSFMQKCFPSRMSVWRYL